MPYTRLHKSVVCVGAATPLSPIPISIPTVIYAPPDADYKYRMHRQKVITNYFIN